MDPSDGLDGRDNFAGMTRVFLVYCLYGGGQLLRKVQRVKLNVAGVLAIGGLTVAGFEVRKIYDVPNKQNNSKNVCLYGIGVVVTMVSFFAVKILEKKAGGTTLMIALPVIYIGFAYTTFRFFMVWEEKIEAFPDNIWKKAVWTISACLIYCFCVMIKNINCWNQLR